MKRSSIVLLGYSVFNLPLFMEIINETFGTTEFLVIRNIQSLEGPLIHNHLDYYNYKFADWTDFNSIEWPCLLGVTNVKAKVAVHNFFLNKYQNLNNNYISLLHPKSYISSSALIEKSVVIEPQSIVSSQTRIGFGVTIKRGSNIGHHNQIGDFTSINPGCTLSGNVTIGSQCTIGSGTVIRDSINIGENCIIGMGSIVTKDIPANTIAYGNPCKVVKENIN